MGLPRSCGSVALGLALIAAGPAHGDPPTISESKFELFVHDAEQSAEFYAVLGFSVVHRKAADGYTTLASGPTVVALSPLPWWLPIHWLGLLRHPPLGTEIVFYSDRLEALRAALIDTRYSPGSIALQSWGNRDFRVTDPDGYYVRVSEGSALPASE